MFVYLETPVGSGRKAVCCSAISRVSTDLRSNQRAKEVDGNCLGGAQSTGELCSSQDHPFYVSGPEKK